MCEKIRDANKTFLQDQDQDFCFKTMTKIKTSLFGQDQDQNFAPQDQDLYTVLDNLAKNSYKQCIWLNKVM